MEFFSTDRTFTFTSIRSRRSSGSFRGFGFLLWRVPARDHRRTEQASILASVGGKESVPGTRLRGGGVPSGLSGESEEYLARLFIPERLFPRIDELARSIRPAVAAESAFRLERFDRSLTDRWQDPPPPPGWGWADCPGAPVEAVYREARAFCSATTRRQIPGIILRPLRVPGWARAEFLNRPRMDK
jgi:hypothetical protein